MNAAKNKTYIKIKCQLHDKFVGVENTRQKVVNYI